MQLQRLGNLMIGKIKGMVETIGTDTVLVDVGGIDI